MTVPVEPMSVVPPDAGARRGRPAAGIAGSGDRYGSRRAAARERMRDAGLDVLLVTAPEDIYYLAGLDHQGYFAFTMLVLPMSGEPTVIARAMEGPTIRAQCPGCRHVTFADDADPADAVQSVLAPVPDATLGVDMAGMWFPLAIWERVRATRAADRIRDASDLVSDLRQVKGADEIACVRAAGQISAAAMAAGRASIHSGCKQADVAAAIYAAMFEGGGEYPGFVPLIRTREHLDQEHVTWRDQRITDGDAVFIELSASVGRYHAPMTRIAFVERIPPGTHAAARICQAGLDAVLDTLRPGRVAADVYAAWQEQIDRGLGHDRYRRHHCGYLVGIGFPPSWVGGARVRGLRADSDLRIEAGMTFHVLSWILGQAPADYAISDTVLVTPTGGELLTTGDRKPFLVPAPPS